MNPLPEISETFIKNNVSLVVYEHPLKNIFRLKVGISFVDLNERDVFDLIEVLNDYNPYSPDKARRKWFNRKDTKSNG